VTNTNEDSNPVIDFGKHKTMPYSRVPVAYLRWMVNSQHERSNLAEIELKRRNTVLPTMEISGHATDRASLLFLQKWRSARTTDEGIHSWLHRTAEQAIASGNTDDKGRFIHEDMLFAFTDLETNRWPVLKTVMKNSRYTKPQ